MSVEGDSINCTPVEAAIVAWFDAIKSGPPPDREEFLRHYPDIGPELREFFANYDCFRERAAASNDRPPAVETPSPEVQPTVLTSGSECDTVTTSVRYRELELFKKGGLGALYRAYDESLHRETAVKFVGDKFAANPALVNQFRVEAEITGRLDHPGVVPVYGIGEDWYGRPFYVMRLVKGRELTQAIQDYHSARTARPVDAETRRKFLTLLEQLASACKTVAYAHDVGIIHCDVKPANIMVGKYGETFVLDWGLAITFERTSTFMANEPAMRPRSSGDSAIAQRGGTYGYISPEQLSPDDPIAPTSDVYSLGATLYEILTGVPPFSGRDRNVADHIRRGDFQPPRSVVRSIPRRLEAICLKAMNLSPKNRYPTAKHLANDLTNWMHDDELLAAPDRWYHRIGRLARRHRPLTASILVATLVMWATATWTVYQAEKHRYVRKQSEVFQKSLNTSLDTFEDLCRPLANGEMNNLGVFRPFADKINDFATDYLDEFERNPMMLSHTGRMYELRATVLRVLSSDTANALTYYQRAGENYQAQLRVATDDTEIERLQRRLAHLQLNEGHLYIQRDEFENADGILSDARKALEKLRKQNSDDPELGRDLAEVYHSLGEVNLYREVEGNVHGRALQISQDFFEMSANLRTILLQSANGDDRRNHQRDLARSHGYLGDLYLAQGLIAKAEKSYKDSKDLRQELFLTNRMDPEYRVQYARGLGNFGSLERNYTGNMQRAVEMLTEAEEIQEGLTRDFPEVKTFHSDLAYTHNNLAEVYLWLAAEQPQKSSDYVNLSRSAAEKAGKTYAQRLRSGDQLSAHGLAWSRVTLASLAQLEGTSAAALAGEAAELLAARPGGRLALGRGELVTLALALSLQDDASGAHEALSEAVQRGENTVVRFEKHDQAGLRSLANDATFGPQYRDLCHNVRLSLKTD